MASALLYDLFMAPLERLGLRHARRRLVRGVRGRVLELGAGTGLLFAAYDAPPAIAVDLDGAALARARRRNPRVALVRADAAQLPFREETFDTVVDSLALCSVSDPDAVLGEARRVLRRGGELRMLEHVRPPGAALGRLFDLVAPAWLAISGGCHIDRHTADRVGPAGFGAVRTVSNVRGVIVHVTARKQDA